MDKAAAAAAAAAEPTVKVSKSGRRVISKPEPNAIPLNKWQKQALLNKADVAKELSLIHISQGIVR